jgi:hypothetical protein
MTQLSVVIGNFSDAEEPRRRPRLKNHEDADRTELAMRRTERKNIISGNISPKTKLVPTVLNSENSMLVDITNKIGITSSSNDKEVHRIIFVVKCLTRNDMFKESKKNKSMLQPTNTDLFTQGQRRWKRWLVIVIVITIWWVTILTTVWLS